MEKFNLKLFISLAIIASIVSFFVFFKKEQAYKTELDILILPRNEKTAESLDQTVESIKQIPLSLSFYDKMLEANKSITDGAVGQSDYERKEFWNKKINSQRIDGSGVIRLEVFDENQSQAEIIASQLKNDLFVVISKYYNIKTDLEPRLIDGPITGSTVSGDIWKNIAESAGLGTAIGFFVTLIISGLFGFVSQRRQDYFNSQYAFKKDILPKEKSNETEKRDFRYSFSENKSAAERALEEIQAEEVASNQEKTPEKNSKSLIGPEDAPVEIKEKNVSTGKKASAPSNLPFADEELPEIFNSNRSENAAEESTVSEEPKASYKEATPEEVKARIAKLLNGRI